MIIYMIENFYNKYKNEIDAMTQDIKSVLVYNSIDTYFSKLNAILRTKEKDYYNIIQTWYEEETNNHIKELIDVFLHDSDQGYLERLIKEDDWSNAEGKLFALYNLITHIYVFEDCDNYIKMFNTTYKKLSKTAKKNLSPRIHIAKFMIDMESIIYENYEYNDLLIEVDKIIASIKEYNDSDYLMQVLNQHLLQFLDMYLSRVYIRYPRESLNEIEAYIDKKIKTDYYFNNYQYSPYYASIKYNMYRIKKHFNVLNKNAWTLQNYINICEKDYENTIKVLTQHNYINQDSYFDLRKESKEKE